MHSRQAGKQCLLLLFKIYEVTYRKMCGSMCFHIHLNEAKASQPAKACSSIWKRGRAGRAWERESVLRHVLPIAKIDFNKATTLDCMLSCMVYTVHISDTLNMLNLLGLHTKYSKCTSLCLVHILHSMHSV